MDKKIRVGPMSFNAPPEYSARVGQSIEELQNIYERGDIVSMVIVAVTKGGCFTCATGEAYAIPTACLIAESLSTRVIDGLQSAYFPEEDDED